MPPKELTQEQIIDAAITVVGVTQTANEGGEPELVFPVLIDLFKNPKLAMMVMWKFASEIGIAARRANPDVEWPILSEGLRNHWREENERFRDINPE